jgi:hypothetical protein
MKNNLPLIIIKPIIIVLPNNKLASSAIKKRLFNKLKHLKNIKFEIFTFEKFPLLRKHTYYFLKKYDINKFRILKRFKNKIIYEPLDCHWKESKYKKQFNKIFKIIDHIIFNNKILNDLFKLNKSTIIYHEYDTRFPLNNELSDLIYYIGMKQKTSLTDDTFSKYNIHNITSYQSIINNTINYRGIHIDYVLPNLNQYNIHTTTKLATALYTKSVFICNKVPIYLEIFGDEYELYFKDDLSDLNIIIEKAKNIINDKEKYDNYLKMQSKYLEYFNPDNILMNYYNLFRRFNKK